MRVRKSVWMLGLAATLIAGSMVAAESDPPIAAPEKVDVSLEAADVDAPQPAAESIAEVVSGEGEVVFTNATGTGPKGFNCSCECTCPTSGIFEVQTFTLPPWTNRSCQSFNGDSCSVGPFDTCNTVRRYQNCVTL